MGNDVSKPGYRVWAAGRGLSLFMLLPAVAMAVASVLVPADAVADDGAPLRSVLLLGAGFWLVTNFAVLFVLGRINEKRRRLFEQGLDGRALILGVEETGTTINDMPVLKIRLRVNDGYHGEYETVHKEAIPLTVIPRLVQGGEILVKVDRERQERLLLLL
jgi:hypothetical protein